MSIPPSARAGLLLAIAQLVLIELLGTSPAAVLTVGVGVTYIVAFGWADPLQLRMSDAAGALATTAVGTLPLAVIEPIAWAALCGASLLGLGLSRIQLLPRTVRPDRSGIEAHLARMRREGIDRPQGRAERARVTAGLDPLGGFLGGASSPSPIRDPYEDSKTLQYDPTEGT